MKSLLISLFLVVCIFSNAQAPDLNFCSNGSFVTVDLSVQSNILISQQPSGNYQVTYYNSLSNANIGLGAMPLQSTFTVGITTIYARVTNIGSSAFTVSSFAVIVQQSPQIPAQSDVVVCSNYILPALSVGNYCTGTGGSGQVLSAGTSITQSMTVYVFAQSGNCSDEESFTVIVNPFPQVELQDGIICVSADGFVFNPFLLNTNLSASMYSFQWTLNGTLLTDGTQPSYLATETGIYTVTVTGLDFQCVDSESATVIASNPVTQASASFSGTTLTVEVENPELYLFGLDGQTLQESPVFLNVQPGFHEISLCALSGCGKLIFTIDNSLSTVQNSFTNFSFFPNPVASVLKFSASEIIENIEVSNLIGQKVLSKKLYGSSEVDLSALTKGIYTVQISSAEKEKTFKVIKE